MSVPITAATVRTHAQTSSAHTRPHRMARVLEERFGYTVEDVLDALLFDNHEKLVALHQAVTLKQPKKQG